MADDLVADAFLIVWERRADRELDGDDARAWLYGVATNLLRRHVRTEETRLRHLALEGPSGGEADDDPQPRVARCSNTPVPEHGDAARLFSARSLPDTRR